MMNPQKFHRKCHASIDCFVVKLDDSYPKHIYSYTCYIQNYITIKGQYYANSKKK